MQEKEIFENLCANDPRNPYNFSDTRHEHCMCDNCHTGRDKLATELLKTREALDEVLARLEIR